MDIFEFAMNKEKLSEEYYRQISRKTNNKGLNHILTMLADEERKHFEIVRQLQEQTPQTATQTNVLGKAQAVFEKMRGATENFDVDVTELELYEKARDIEKQSRQFYLDKADEVADASHQEIFKMLANEEQKHFVILEKICDFVARPQWFIENAEMYHFDDYVDGVL